ncbi:hypothetical protein BDN72DRAFT_846361 [Pluteus cervinus]|uniref:Uncharacterized protein n=1 Tax=Pluteus cervinus TaxID=181527 RepID=A0ACD3AG61_9AGAR|nr:hypothetical protein BDN72DRAFT_846361 [Pluteus cervinus]
MYIQALIDYRHLHLTYDLGHLLKAESFPCSSKTASHMKNPVTAQDCALSIPEILSHIFDQLVVPITCLDDVKAANLRRTPYPVQYPGDELVIQPILLGDEVLTRRLTLRAAALSCRKFSGPALDALWQTMNTLFPLISILPSTNTSNILYVHLSQCSPATLDRFSMYADRIRTLTVEGTVSKNPKAIQVHHSAYCALRVSSSCSAEVGGLSRRIRLIVANLYTT